MAAVCVACLAASRLTALGSRLVPVEQRLAGAGAHGNRYHGVASVLERAFHADQRAGDHRSTGEARLIHARTVLPRPPGCPAVSRASPVTAAYEEEASGVHVLLVLDAFGSQSLAGARSDSLRAAGVEVVLLRRATPRVPADGDARQYPRGRRPVGGDRLHGRRLPITSPQHPSEAGGAGQHRGCHDGLDVPRRPPARTRDRLPGRRAAAMVASRAGDGGDPAVARARGGDQRCTRQCAASSRVSVARAMRAARPRAAVRP